MPFTNDELNAVKEAVSTALVNEFGTEGNGLHFLRVLDSIDAAAQMADLDLPPFHIGARVHRVYPNAAAVLDGRMIGTVTKRVEASDGELHTVLVRWDGDDPTDAAEPISPRDLAEVTE